MRVRIFDRRETPGYGIRTITISGVCPRCGRRRGAPHPIRLWIAEDQATVETDRWSNPCGHIDLCIEVLREADTLLAEPHTATLPPVTGEQPTTQIERLT